MTCCGTPNMVKCSGYHGYPCQYQAHVSAKKQKCKPCWRLEALPLPQQQPPNPWPQMPSQMQMPPPPEPEQNEEVHEVNLDAVKWLRDY